MAGLLTMFAWVFDISTFIAIASILALFITYEQTAQASKKAELARIEAQLADERAAAAEREARALREKFEVLQQRSSQLEERYNEHHRLLRVLIEREETSKVVKRSCHQTSDIVGSPPHSTGHFFRSESRSAPTAAVMIPICTPSVESLALSEPLSSAIGPPDLSLATPSISEAESSSSNNISRIRTAITNKCKHFDKKMKLRGVKALSSLSSRSKKAMS